MTDKERKKIKVYGGVIKYFPKALREVAKVSYHATEQHHPDKEMHWDRNKSNEHMESLCRHLLDYAEGDEFDDDGQRHLAKLVWRVLAQLQIDLEREEGVYEKRDGWVFDESKLK